VEVGKGKGMLVRRREGGMGRMGWKWTGELGCNAWGEGMIMILRKEGSNTAIQPNHIKFMTSSTLALM
jgi:hypothetical protein